MPGSTARSSAARAKAAPTDRLAAEAVISSESTPVEWKGRILYVKSARKWKTRGLQALRTGDIETWAETSLEKDSVDAWKEIDPTLDDCEEFFSIWEASTGESRPES